MNIVVQIKSKNELDIKKKVIAFFKEQSKINHVGHDSPPLPILPSGRAAGCAIGASAG